MFYFCPKLCGYYKTQCTTTTTITIPTTTTTTITKTTTTTSTTTTTTTTCRPYSCLNNGYFNEILCMCECLYTWTGQFCETPLCSNEPAFCSELFESTQCLQYPSIAALCPKLCGACNCGETLVCENGGDFIRETCECGCK